MNETILALLAFGWSDILGEAGVSGSIQPLYLPGGIILMVVAVTYFLHRINTREMSAAIHESTKTIFGAGFVLIFTIPMVWILINSGVNAAGLIGLVAIYLLGISDPLLRLG